MSESISNQYPMNIIDRKYFLVRKALDFMGTVLLLKDKKILPQKKISSKFWNYQIPQLISNCFDKSFFFYLNTFLRLEKCFHPGNTFKIWKSFSLLRIKCELLGEKTLVSKQIFMREVIVWDKGRKFFRKLFQLIKHESCLHIKNSQWICSANQLASFFMMATLVFNEPIQVLGKTGGLAVNCCCKTHCIVFFHGCCRWTILNWITCKITSMYDNQT